MFAGDSQMLRNKRHFVISVIAINVFYCMLILNITIFKFDIIDLVYTYMYYLFSYIYTFFLLNTLSLTPHYLIYEQFKCTVSKC